MGNWQSAEPHLAVTDFMRCEYGDFRALDRPANCYLPINCQLLF